MIIYNGMYVEWYCDECGQYICTFDIDIADVLEFDEKYGCSEVICEQCIADRKAKELKKITLFCDLCHQNKNITELDRYDSEKELIICKECNVSKYNVGYR